MGRTSILAFLREYERKADGPYDFRAIDDDYDRLPERAGAYIIRAVGRRTWPYPWGRSPVFYIGKAKAIRDRLWDHWDAVRQHKRDYSPDWPIYAYAATYASHYYVFRTWQGMTPDSIEKELIGRFVDHYGARPVANGQTRWERV